MFGRLISVLFIVLIPFQLVLGQQVEGEENNLAYFVTAPTNQQPLLPVVENELRKLRKKDGALLFDKVFNLNSFSKSDTVETLILDYLTFINRKNRPQDSEVRTQILSEVGSFLKTFDKLLFVNINPNSNLIEFQFWAYDVFFAANDVPIVDKLNYNSSSAILDISKFDGRSKNLEVALRQVFIEANVPTRIEVLDKSGQPVDTIRSFVGDPIELQIRLIDSDTEPEDIDLKWSLLKGDSVLFDALRYSNPTKLTQVKTKEKGIHIYELKAHDGTGESPPRRLVLKIIPRAVLAYDQVLESDFYVQSGDYEFYDDRSKTPYSSESEIQPKRGGWHRLVMSEKPNLSKRQYNLYPIRYPEFRFDVAFDSTFQIDFKAIVNYAGEGNSGQVNEIEVFYGDSFENDAFYEAWEANPFVLSLNELRKRAWLGEIVPQRYRTKNYLTSFFPRVSNGYPIESIGLYSYVDGLKSDSLFFEVKHKYTSKVNFGISANFGWSKLRLPLDSTINPSMAGLSGLLLYKSNVLSPTFLNNYTFVSELNYFLGLEFGFARASHSDGGLLTPSSRASSGFMAVMAGLEMNKRPLGLSLAVGYRYFFSDSDLFSSTDFSLLDDEVLSRFFLEIGLNLMGYRKDSFAKPWIFYQRQGELNLVGFRVYAPFVFNFKRAGGR